ncbi:MAG: hypothetical protein QOK47_1467 [Actinomycetota bacterium]|jgi:hypothetical protein|nr:hypothetical protein [Actinomycetota bacterium]
MALPDMKTSDPAELDQWARLELEKAATSDDATKLTVLDELHTVLETGLDEDPSTRP